VTRPAAVSHLMAEDRSARDYIAQLERVAGDDFRVDRIGASHSTDPGTSQQAAKLNFPRSGNQRRRVLEALVARGSRGATFEELVVDTGIESAAKRLTELVQGGWVFQTEATRPTHTGSPATVHLVSEKALHELERERRANQTVGGQGPASFHDADPVRDQAPPSGEGAQPSAVHDPEPVSLFGDEPAPERSATSHYTDVEAA
jgi:hypothetical protein